MAVRREKGAGPSPKSRRPTRPRRQPKSQPNGTTAKAAVVDLAGRRIERHGELRAPEIPPRDADQGEWDAYFLEQEQWAAEYRRRSWGWPA